jgi:hypothetical protein
MNTFQHANVKWVVQEKHKQTKFHDDDLYPVAKADDDKLKGLWKEVAHVY